MLFLRCVHPPGAATALAPVLGNPHPALIDAGFIAVPVGINSLLMLMLAIVINRFILRRNYPLSSALQTEEIARGPKPFDFGGIDTADIQAAVNGFEGFLDVSLTDLSKIFTRLQARALAKNLEPLTCGDIKMSNIITVEYDTEVEQAWTLINRNKMKVLPVLDRSKRVIGIVTPYDFFKYLNLTPYRSFQDKFMAFVKSTADITTQKPEAVGHIMTRKVKTISHKTSITDAELMILVIREGHRYIPIVDEQRRFIGLVFQGHWLSALFNQNALAFKNIRPERRDD